MAEVFAGSASYADGTQCAYYREQDTNDVTGVRVTVPVGHTAQLRVDIYSPQSVAGTYIRYFPGGTTTDTGAVAPAGGSDETVTLPKPATPAYQWSDSICAWR